MPQGLQIFGANGTIIIDTSTLTLKGTTILLANQTSNTSVSKTVLGSELEPIVNIYNRGGEVLPAITSNATHIQINNNFIGVANVRYDVAVDLV